MIDSAAFPADVAWMRRGHFAMASGHHGSLWLDLELLFARPAALQPMIVELGRRLAAHAPDAVCGPMSGGALLAFGLAQAFDWEFLFTEPRWTAGRPSAYALPAALVPRIAGRNIAIVDDAINAASAVTATHADLRRHGARCVAIGTLIALGSAPAAAAAGMRLPLESLSHLQNDLWMPADCPFCRRGIPLDK